MDPYAIDDAAQSWPRGIVRPGIERAYIRAYDPTS
jgi:hypothetical protein